MDKPFATLAKSLECVDRALKHNSLAQLQSLFAGSKLLLPTSDDVHNYFLIYSNYETSYELSEIKQVLNNFKGSILTSDGDLQLSLRMYLPDHSCQQLAKLLKNELARCMLQVFDNKGQLNSWLSNMFLPDQLKQLYYQFGEVAVKFKLFELFTIEYCQLFQCYLSPADKACSDVIIELMLAELRAYQRLAGSLAKLEHNLNIMDIGFKAKDKAESVFEKGKLFFFSDRFIISENLYQCFECIADIVKTPHNKELIERLDKISLDIDAQTDDIYWRQFLGTLGVFIGSFLLVASVLGTPMSTSIIVSSSLLLSGLGFFGAGVSLFQSGSPKRFETVVANFLDKTLAIEDEYQNSLL